MIFLRNLHQHTVTSVPKKPFHQQQTDYRTAKNYSNTHIDDDQWSKLTFVMEPLQQLTRNKESKIIYGWHGANKYMVMRFQFTRIKYLTLECHVVPQYRSTFLGLPKVVEDIDRPYGSIQNAPQPDPKSLTYPLSFLSMLMGLPKIKFK